MRVFGASMATLVIRALSFNHPTYGDELGRMIHALDREQTIDTVAKLDGLMRTNLWRPRPMEATMYEYRKPLLPCRWLMIGEEDSTHPEHAFVRRITRKMVAALARDDRCSPDIAESMRINRLITRKTPRW